MAVTVTATILSRGMFVGGHKYVIASLALSGAYVADGFYLNSSAVNGGNYLGLKILEDLQFMDGVTSIGHVPYYNKASSANLVKLFAPGSDIVTDVFPYTLASTNAADDVAGTTTDANAETALGANYKYISDSATAYNNTTAFTIAAQPDVPRNITIKLWNNSGGTHDTSAANYEIVGTFNGVAQTETLAFAAGISMANSTAIFRSTSKPFDRVTSITPSAGQFNGIEHEAGIGSRIGLSRPLLTPAYTDVKMATLHGAPVAISLVTDQTTGTVTPTVGSQSMLFTTITAGYELMVKYLAGKELVTGTTVTSTLKVMAIGV